VLRTAGGSEVQTRQTPISTNGPVHNDYTGLTTCVSLNTAVAAKVGSKRVTFEPKPSGQPDPNDLILRIDGAVTTLPAGGMSLGGGGHISPSAGSGIQLDFPDQTTVVVTPGFWNSYNVWFLNVDAYHSGMYEGVMGVRARGSWLPALRDGTNMGPKPASLGQRFTDLNQTFADSWRVTDKTSLFDYEPGTTTATFTHPNWPPHDPPCVAPKAPPIEGVSLAVARKACARITGKIRNRNCVDDVRVTGNLGFAKTYEISQKLQAGATAVVVSDDRDLSNRQQPIVLTATVSLQVQPSRTAAAVGGHAVPTGAVQFYIDGQNKSPVLKLDKNGQAWLKTARFEAGKHTVRVHYVPTAKTVFLESWSDEETLIVK
jgi:hypothetical protein